MAIPVTAGIRGFAGIPVPAKFHFFAWISYRDFTVKLVIKTCQKIKIFQQKFDKKHVKINTDFNGGGGGGLSDKCTYMYAHLYILL